MDFSFRDSQYRVYVYRIIEGIFAPGTNEEEVVLRNLNAYLDITDAIKSLGKNFLGEVLRVCQMIHSDEGLHNRSDSGYPLDRLLCIISGLATLNHKKILRRMLSWEELENSHRAELQRIINRLREDSLFERCYI